MTFRLPNPRVETEFRLIRAFINMASGASVAKHFGFSLPPLFEVILPLTETAEEMLARQVAYQQIHNLKHPLFKLDGFLTNLRVIPLFEDVSTITTSDAIVEKYIRLYTKQFKKSPPYMRPYVARSDPALNSGIIPTVIGIKIALSRYKALSKKLGLPLYPIIVAGSLPFRGGLNPSRVKDFVAEYKGIRTVTIQSAFRYDYPLEEVTSAVLYLEKTLPKQEAVSITPKEEKALMELISYAEGVYKEVIEEVAPLINTVAKSVPRRRERFLHVGLFGYSRGEGKVSLPRAITFTCCLYSIGVPPELIGTGTAIEFAKRNGMLGLLEKYYVNLKMNLLEAGRFLNKKNLKKLATASDAWKKVEESIESIEEYVGQELGPKSADEKKHESLTSKILKNKDERDIASVNITKAGVIRRSLG